MEKEKRITEKLGKFNVLHVEGGLDIELIPSEKLRLEFSTREENPLSISMQGKVLYIKYIGEFANPKIKVKVFYTKIYKITSELSCRIVGRSSLGTKNLTVVLDNSQLFLSNIVLEKLTSDLSRNSRFFCKGSAAIHNLNIREKSYFKGGKLLTEISNFYLSGKSRIQINSKKNLDFDCVESRVDNVSTK